MTTIDVTLGQSFLRILDQRFGGKARAALGIALSVATFVTYVLQATLDNVGVLPQWEFLGAYSIWGLSAVQLLGRFTKFGNALNIDPPILEVDPPVNGANGIVVKPEDIPALLPAPVEVHYAPPGGALPVNLPAIAPPPVPAPGPKPVAVAVPVE